MELFIEELKRMYQNLYDTNMEIASLNQDPYESSETKDLHIDLCSMQSEYPEIGGNRQNGGFKSHYADIEGLILAIRPLMKKYSFSLSAKERLCLTFGPHLRVRLTHSKSGQWIETRSLLNAGKPGDQEYGKMLTYRTRYSIKTLLMIPVSKDPADDDGEEERKRIEKKSPATQPDTNTEYLSFYQVSELRKMLEGHPLIEKELLDTINRQSLNEIPKEVFFDAKKLIEGLKKE